MCIQNGIIQPLSLSNNNNRKFKQKNQKELVIWDHAAGVTDQKWKGGGTDEENYSVMLTNANKRLWNVSSLRI